MSEIKKLENKESSFIMDSGCTHHMVSSATNLCNVCPYSGIEKKADGRNIDIVEIGD
jgi:hypothetical protein